MKQNRTIITLDIKKVAHKKLFTTLSEDFDGITNFNDAGKELCIFTPLC